MNQGTTNAFIVFLVWILFYHSTKWNAIVLGVQALRNPTTRNKIDSFSFKTISKNGNSHATDKMSQIKEEEILILLPNNGPATVTSSFLQLPNNDGPAQFKQLSVSNNDCAITTLSFLHLYVPFRKMTCTNLLLLPVWDNPAVTTVTHAQNLLLYAQIGSAITMVTHAQNLLLFCVQDNPAITMATPADSKLHLIVAFIWRALTAQITFIDPCSVSERAQHAQVNLQTFWWLLITFVILMVISPPLFQQGTMPLIKRELIQLVPIALWHVWSRGDALHAPEGRSGQGILPNATDPPLFPRSPPLWFRLVFILCKTVFYGKVPKTVFCSVHK